MSYKSWLYFKSFYCFWANCSMNILQLPVHQIFHSLHLNTTNPVHTLSFYFSPHNLFPMIFYYTTIFWSRSFAPIPFPYFHLVFLLHIVFTFSFLLFLYFDHSGALWIFSYSFWFTFIFSITFDLLLLYIILLNVLHVSHTDILV